MSSPSAKDRRRYSPSDSGSDLMASNVTATMLTGPALFAGVGWLLDRWWGTTPWLVAIGLLLGMGLALYVVWIRYGTGSQPDPGLQAPPQAREVDHP